MDNKYDSLSVLIRMGALFDHELVDMKSIVGSSVIEEDV